MPLRILIVFFLSFVGLIACNNQEDGSQRADNHSPESITQDSNSTNESSPSERQADNTSSGANLNGGSSLGLQVKQGMLAYQGETYTDAETVAQKVLENHTSSNNTVSNNTVEYDSKLVIEILDQTPVSKLNELIRHLQLQGFRNCVLQFEGREHQVPPPYANSSGSRFIDVKLDLKMALDGQLASIDLHFNEDAIGIAGDSADAALKETFSVLGELIAKSDQEAEDKYGTLIIELNPDADLSAIAFVGVMDAAASFVIEHQEKTRLELSLWPFGYPREVQPSLPLEGLIELDVEPMEDPDIEVPQVELKEFDLDDNR